MKQKKNKQMLLLTIIFSLGSIQQILTHSNAIEYSSLELKTVTFNVDKPGMYRFANDVQYNFTPISTSVSRPMVKIVASDVSIDFHNIGVRNLDDSRAGWVGIEIGWSPQELLDDPTRVQPKNITIQGLSLYNFDAGLVIHHGVQNVTIDTCNFYDTAIGVAILGTSASYCHDIKMKHVNIFGYDQDFHIALENIKNYIEVTCAYGANYWMPMKADPFNSNSLDVYTYYGAWMNYLNKGYFNDFEIQDIGYSQYPLVSEGNGKRTEAVGIKIQNSKRIELEKSSVSEIASEIKAVGLQLDNVREIIINDSEFSYATSKKKAVGIEVTNALALPYSVEALRFENIFTKSNVSDDTAIGMDVSSVRGLFGNNLVCKYNKGALQCYGVYANNLYTADLRSSTLSENSATRVVNDVATDQGIVAAAFYGENINSFQARKIDFCSVQALNSAYGLYLKNSSSCQFWDCQFVANIATMMRSGEAAAIRSQQDAQEISKHAPVVVATNTGAYGAYVVGSKYIKFEKCAANSNTGHRAVGFSFKSCRAVALWNSFASTQFATGQMFDSSLYADHAALPTAIPIISYHKPLLFGDLTKTTVDAVATTDLFLSKLATVRAAQIAGLEPAYADVKALIATSSLMQALVARYRLWSVAFGVQAHDVTGFLLKECICTGQVSMFDNGIGMCFSGRNSGHAVEQCNLSFNVGGLSAVQTATTNPLAQYAYSYNLIGHKLFWDTLLSGRQPWTILNTASLGVDVTCMAFSPNGTKLALGTASGEIKIYNTTTWALEQTLVGHLASVTAVAWRPDGTQLASCDSGILTNIKIWNTSTWLATQNLTHTSTGVYALAWKPDGTRLASGAQGLLGQLVIWNTSTWLATNTLTHGLVRVQALAWSPDSASLVSGTPDVVNNMRVWNTTSWAVTATLSDHTSGVTSLSFNSTSSLLASASIDGLVKVWNTSGWTVSQTLNGASGAVNAVKFKPDNKLIAAGYANNVVKVWKTSNWGEIEKTLSDFTDSVLCLDWNIDGRTLATGSADNSYRVYNTNLYKVAATTLDIGLYTASSNYIAQDSLAFSNTIDGDSVFIDLKGTQRWLVSPVGPVSAGLVMGDMMLEGMAKNNYMYGNLGNAGHTHGVLLDKAFSVTLDNNTIAGSISNTHGTTVGVLDVTAHSPNLFMRNFLEGNKCSIFNNGNYFVPFNPTDSNTLAFPVKKIMNGKFSNTTTEYDNVVVEYSQSAEFYPYDYIATIPMHPDLRSYLSANNCWA